MLPGKLNFWRSFLSVCLGLAIQRRAEGGGRSRHMSCLPSSYFTATSASLVRTLIIMQQEVAAAESWTPPPSWRVTVTGGGGEGVSDSKSCARVGIWHCASISWTGTHHSTTSQEATLRGSSVNHSAKESQRCEEEAAATAAAAAEVAAASSLSCCI